MNYWLLTTEYPPLYGGGISTYCYHTCCMLSEKGHQVTVFVNDKSAKSVIISKEKEARVIRFNPYNITTANFLGDTTFLSYAFAIITKKIIEEEGKPDFIECQDYNGIGYFLLQFKACLFEWCSNIPIVVTMHSPSFLYLEYNEVPIYERPNFWIGEMERFCIQAADLVISPSQYLIDELKKRFIINESNLHVVVNPYKFTSTTTSKEVLPAILNNTLTFYGKLSPQKGTFKILELFKSLWDEGFKESFTMIGGQDIVFHPQGETMGTIVKKKYQSYIEKGILIFKKEIDPSKKESFFHDATIFIVPSIVDNLPYVVLELMSLGKIVIVSKQGGQAEIVTDEHDGFIFNYEDSQSFKNILKKVLNLTSEQRVKIGKLAVRKVEQMYAYDKVYTQKIKLLKSLQNNYEITRCFPFIRVITNESTKNHFTETNSLLSVIIPYYNLGKYINETVESVLNSTYKNIEIIIMNDGSTDLESISKLQEYKNHKRIKIIHKENSGLADTRNAGAELAEGTFLAFLDADDMVVPTYYEKAIKILRHYKNVHFVGAWTQYFEGSKAIWPTFNPEPPLILTHNTINSSSLVYKRNSFLASGKNDKKFKIGLEDYESVIHMKADGLNGVAIPEILFKYRVRKNSMIKGVNKKIRADYYDMIQVKHKDFFSHFRREIAVLVKYYPPLSIDNDTLDNLPFQQIPILNKLVHKFVAVLKTNPKLKKSALAVKRMFWKQ